MSAVRGNRAAVLVACIVALAGADPALAEPRDRLPAPPRDEDYRPVSEARVRLGQLLFYDKLLSGNRNIACGTCHHHDHASADGLSLPVGQGGVGVGPERTVGADAAMIERRVPRHSPALFNLGATEFTTLFHDGRLSVRDDEPSGFDSPAAEDLPPGLDSVVAAQAMFPVLSSTEMAGEPGDNAVIDATAEDLEFAWERVAARLRSVPDYVDRFRGAFDDVSDAGDITMVHAANAIGEFVSFEWRADRSPFDRFLRGDEGALDDEARHGMSLFYGDGGCADCHAGPFQTDHHFHAIAMPQVGYVRTRRFDPVVRDMGRINESDDVRDRYRFRTPSLRNVAETRPYGHAGAFGTLEAVVRHHLDPVSSFRAYDRFQAVLPAHPVESRRDFAVLENEREVERLLAANELEPRTLDETEVAALLAFLRALTDPTSLAGRLGRPQAVPSGLDVE